jgi:hypothetical protein
MFHTSKFAISPAGPIPVPPPSRKVLGRFHPTSLNLTCTRGAATCILPWFEILMPDFPNLLVSEAFVSMGASDAGLLRGGGDSATASNTVISTPCKPVNPSARAFLRSLVAGVDRRVWEKFIHPTNSSSLSRMVRPNSSPVATERLRTFSTAWRASLWSMRGDLCGLLKTGLVGVEEDVEHFLERCHRLGRGIFILMHDVAVMRAMCEGKVG